VLAWIGYRAWMFARGLFTWARKHPLPAVLGVLLAFAWWGVLTLADLPGDRLTGPVLLLVVFLSPGLFMGLWAMLAPRRYLEVQYAWKVRDAWPKVAQSCGLSAHRPDGTTVISRLVHVRRAPGAVVLRIETFTGQTPDDLYRAAPAITTALRAHGYEPSKVKPGVLDLALFTTATIAPAVATMPGVEHATPDNVPVGRS